jgi:phage host-nuclease inhibitor protein Gam
VANHRAEDLQLISKTDKNLTGIEQLRALVAITKKISESLKYQLTAEQIDVLVEEHKQVMAKLAKVPKAEMKQHQDLLKNIQKQVQFVQKELDNYHDAVKDKLISFGKKRKQINAYNALA